MKLRIDKTRITLMIVLLLCSLYNSAQNVTISNPLEYAAIQNGQSLIASGTNRAATALDTIIVLNGEILRKDNKMKGWTEKYNQYLTNVRGYASSILAGTTLYMEAMQTLTALWEVKTACKMKTQGIAATIPMNNLYLETAIEITRIGGILQKMVAKGGRNNMLNAKERTALLWQLNDEINRLNKKLHSLAFSISILSFEDVWDKAIAGKINKTNGMLATEAHNRMSRAVKQVGKWYKAYEKK